MNKKVRNRKEIAIHSQLLFWKALKQVKVIPFIVSLVMLIALIILLIINQKELPENKSLPLNISIYSSMLAGIIVFLIIEFLQKVFLESSKKRTDIYYNDIFIKQGVEQVFSERGNKANLEYEKKIESAKKRIWAIGMTNGNLIDCQMDKIIDRLAVQQGLDVIISFWAPRSLFKKDYKICNEISLINQQLLIEDGKEIHENTILNRYAKIKASFNRIKSSKTGKLKIVEMTLPTNFTCFIIDDDVFFFPFLSKMESTSTPTILCSANRGVGEQIFEHMKKVFNEKEVTNEVFNSHD